MAAMNSIYGAWLAAAVIAASGLGMLQVWRARRRQARRRQLSAAPLPPEIRGLLNRHLRGYATLPADLRAELDGKVNVFLAEKQFVGCNGFTITPAVRAIVAGHACLLLLNRPGGIYPRVATILVYPGAFVARGVSHEHGIEHELAEVRSGEAWDGGPVVLAWDEVNADLEHGGARNVIVHEFAHQLDDENDAGPGLPPLARPDQGPAWAEVMGREYARLHRSALAGRHSWLDPYGGESPAEFFAVVSEAFFADPAGLRHHHPALYAALQACYPLDPAAWPTVGPQVVTGGP